MDEFFLLSFSFFCFMSYLLYSVYRLVERLVVQLEKEIQNASKPIKKIPPPPPPIPDDWFASHPFWDDWCDKAQGVKLTPNQKGGVTMGKNRVDNPQPETPQEVKV